MDWVDMPIINYDDCGRHSYRYVAVHTADSKSPPILRRALFTTGMVTRDQQCCALLTTRNPNISASFTCIKRVKMTIRSKSVPKIWTRALLSPYYNAETSQ